MTPTSTQTRFKNLSKYILQHKKKLQNVSTMMLKGLPEFPRKSWKSAPRRPGATQGRPWTPKDPQTTPKAPQSTQEDVQGPQKVTQRNPNDSQKIPRDALRIHKGLRKATKKAFNGHPKGTKTQNRKSMQPSSPQQLHRRNSQTTLRRKRSRPCGMRGALEYLPFIF